MSINIRIDRVLDSRLRGNDVVDGAAVALKKARRFLKRICCAKRLQTEVKVCRSLYKPRQAMKKFRVAPRIRHKRHSTSLTVIPAEAGIQDTIVVRSR